METFIYFLRSSNPKRKYLRDRVDNLPRQGQTLWTKHVDWKNLRGNELRGSRENKKKWGILFCKTENCSILENSYGIKINLEFSFRDK